MRKIISETTLLKIEYEYDDNGNDISERCYLKNKVNGEWQLDYEAMRNCGNTQNIIYFFDNGIFDCMTRNKFISEKVGIEKTTMTFDGITTEIIPWATKGNKYEA